MKPEITTHKDKLFIQFYSRNFEVYGKVLNKEGFNEAEFMKLHGEDYYKLEADFSTYDLRIDNSRITVELHGNNLHFDSSIENRKFLDKIEVQCSDQTESYRDLFGSSEDEILVLWFHDYSVSFSYTWFDVADFEPTKLEVYSMNRIDESENNEVYEILSSVQYDGRDPDDESLEGSPKSGYSGPFIVWPKK